MKGYKRWLCLVLTLAMACAWAPARTASAAGTENRDAAIRAARTLLDDTYAAYVNLPENFALSNAMDTDSVYRYANYVKANVDHMRVHDQRWKEYKYELKHTGVSFSGSTARVTTVVNLDYRYAYAPNIASAIYNMNFSIGLTKRGNGYTVSSLDISGLNCFSSFRDKIDERKNKGVEYRAIVQDVMRVRYKQTRDLKDALARMERGARPADLPAPAGAIPSDRARAVEYAEKYAIRPTGERLFSTVDDGDCTVFVSSCLWAGYGGWDKAGGNHALINARFRMTDTWYGTVSGYPSRAWRSVVDLWNYTVKDAHTYGPRVIGVNDGKSYTRLTAPMMKGDIIQFYKYKKKRYGHSMILSIVTDDPYLSNAAHIMVSGHTGDTVHRSLVDILFNYDGLYGEEPKTRLMIPQAARFVR